MVNALRYDAKYAKAIKQVGMHCRAIPSLFSNANGPETLSLAHTRVGCKWCVAGVWQGADLQDDGDRMEDAERRKVPRSAVVGYAGTNRKCRPACLSHSVLRTPRLSTFLV
jgi:hypothetical protein